MSRIANRRELARAIADLVRTNIPDANHYAAVLEALSSVAADDGVTPTTFVLGVPVAAEQTKH